MSTIQKNIYFTVSILSSQNEKICGQIHSPALKHSYKFYDLTELILIMNQIIIDSHVFEQENMRMFSKCSKHSTKDLSYQEIKQDNMKKYLHTVFDYPKESQNVFLIKVMYCQNFTWQGEVQWINQNEIQFFRSALELLQMLDAVL